MSTEDSIRDFYKAVDMFTPKEKPKRPWRHQNCEFCLYDNEDEYIDFVVVEDAEFLYQAKDTDGTVYSEGICVRVEFVQCLRCKRYWFNYFAEDGVLIP